MRRLCLVLAGLVLVLAATACGSSGPPGQAIQRGHLYIPPGWHVLRFRESAKGIHAAGIQLSNVRLPRPLLEPWAPVQPSGDVLPPRLVGLVIATDTAPHLQRSSPVSPPLPPPWPDGSKGWTVGSALAHAPVAEELWFRADGTTYVATVKIGWRASRTATRALARIIRSIH